MNLISPIFAGKGSNALSGEFNRQENLGAVAEEGRKDHALLTVAQTEPSAAVETARNKKRADLSARPYRLKSVLLCQRIVA